MKQQYVTRMNTIIRMSFVILVMLIMGETVPLFADDNGGERNWVLLIGGGGRVSPKYSGADEFSTIPVPFIIARYETPYLDFFLEGDKAGVDVTFGDAIPVSLTTGIGLGEGRKNNEADLLKGTPDLENNYRLFGGLQVSLPFVDISSTVNYFPITANYEEVGWLEIDWLEIEWPEIDCLDENYNGILVNGEVGKEWFRIPFIVNAAAGLSWMNSEYAEANYSVNYPTCRLDTFEAKSGLHDVHVSAIVTMMFSERLGTTLMTEGQYLLNDAADSPLVQNAFQPSAGLFLFYRF